MVVVVVVLVVLNLAITEPRVSLQPYVMNLGPGRKTARLLRINESFDSTEGWNIVMFPLQERPPCLLVVPPSRYHRNHHFLHILYQSESV
jgi:hypothetical protein